MQTLIYHYGALGDFITILPAIKTWRSFHATTVTLLGKPSFGRLAQQAGYIDSIIDATSKESVYLFCIDGNPTKLRNFFIPFDALLIFATDDAPIVVNARKYSTATLFSQPPFPDTRIPIIDYHLSLLSSASPSSISTIPDITFFKKSDTSPLPAITSGISSTIVLHPGSGSDRKNWPFNNFLQVAELLRKKNYAIVWLLGPAEHHLKTPEQDTTFIDLSLIECVNVLSHCTVYIGNDSGITHLAAAAGCNVIALFGPSDPFVWRPVGSGTVKVLYQQCECSPCHTNNSKPLPCDRSCLNTILPESVIASIEEIIESTC